jgi:transcriptional regulator with XRE-family HTH domain
VSLPIDPQTEEARQRVGRALALARRRARLDQAAVCESLRTARPTVSAWETGRRTPDVVTAGLLADLYGLTIDQLVGRAPLPPGA